MCVFVHEAKSSLSLQTKIRLKQTNQIFSYLPRVNVRGELNQKVNRASKKKDITDHVRSCSYSNSNNLRFSLINLPICLKSLACRRHLWNESKWEKIWLLCFRKIFDPLECTEIENFTS